MPLKRRHSSNTRRTIERLEGRNLLAADILPTPIQPQDGDQFTEFFISRDRFEAAIPYGTPTIENGSWPFNTELDYSTLGFRAALEAGTESGDTPDSPELRVDPNNESARFAGVGSLEIFAFGQTIGCTATVISEMHILTAAHCVDLNSDGIADAGIESNTVFHLNDGGSHSATIDIAAIDIHPDFGGFVTTGAFDDIAVATLASPVPTTTPIYPISSQGVTQGQVIELVGYGLSGFGDVTGNEVTSINTVKRSGQNTVDLFVSDDEGTGRLEVFVYDFDGPTGNGLLGGPTIGNRSETVVREGDSGGPVFIEQNGELVIVGVSTFEFSIVGVTAASGLFGTVGGGSLIGAIEADWINSVLDPAESEPEPVPVDVQVNFGVESATMPESKSSGRLTVFRSAASDQPLEVQYLVGGSARPGDDYETLPGTITIPAGKLGKTMLIKPVNDLATEGDETITITLLPNELYSVQEFSKTSITLADDDDASGSTAVSFAQSEVTLTEGDTAQLLLFRSGTVDEALAVSYTISGSAIPGVDFQELVGNVEFQPGSVSATIQIPSIDDSIQEPVDFLDVTLSASDGAAIASPSTARVVITDNDDVPTISFVATNISGNEAGTADDFTISRSDHIDEALTVYYSVSGTAVAGEDFAPLLGSVEMPAGNQTVAIPVTLLNDSMYEDAETLILTFVEDDAYNLLDVAESTMLIEDDDLPVVDFAATSLGVFENAGSGQVVITRAGAVGAPLTIHYSIGGSATAGSDYESIVESVTIPAGEQSITIDVMPIDDISDEPNESIVFTLADSPDYEVGAASSSTVTILDNDLPIVSFERPSSLDVNEGSGGGSLVLNRVGDSSVALTVSYTVSGTAAAGSDYQSLPGTITIPAGSASVNLPITPINDTSDEPNETVIISLSPSQSYARAADSTATATIIDNDEPATQEIQTVLLDVVDAAVVREGDPGENSVARFQVQIRGGGTFFHSIYVYMSTVDGSAKAGSDFDKMKLDRFTIPANTNSITIDVPIIEDNRGEGTEQFQLQLVATAATDGVAPGKVKWADAFGLATITDDD